LHHLQLLLVLLPLLFELVGRLAAHKMGHCVVWVCILGHFTHTYRALWGARHLLLLLLLRGVVLLHQWQHGYVLCVLHQQQLLLLLVLLLLLLQWR
jgi:hypothetical protein